MFGFKNPQALFIVLMLFISTVSIMAEIPSLISYQGRLTDNSGNPVPDAQYSILFTVYDNSETIIWQETHAWLV